MTNTSLSSFRFSSRFIGIYRHIFIFITFLFCSLFSYNALQASENPKREFRGAWLHIIGQGQWKSKTPQQQMEYIINQLDKLKEANCNAVIFQVRPTADAAYASELEPWSAWITGKRGRSPEPLWDPMAFALQEAHKRGMEFHAWLNPYRVTSGPEELPADHVSKKYPERFFKYDNKVFFDPAYQENRDFICEIIDDIVTRYDVDAIHIDDYFYPYPVAGKKIPDDISYQKFGAGKERGDWRRHNVNLLIQQIHSTIKGNKPWVRFGVSPFGIWRNKNHDSRGSESSGLENYDSLYADVLLWAKEGWIDYLAPQLYWELDLAAAPSRKLAKWWNDNSFGVDVYIGQDIQRTMNTPDKKAGEPNELKTKIELSRSLDNIKGNVWWHGYWLTGNYKGVHDDVIKKYQNTIALPPIYGDKSIIPASPSNLRLTKEDGKVYLVWDSPIGYDKMDGNDAVRFVVYEFFPEEDPESLSDSETIVALTPYCRMLLGDHNDLSAIKGNTFVVTSLDRLNRESKPVKFTVK